MRSVIQASLLAALLTITGQATAVTTYNLCAGVTTKSMPDDQVVTLWGYGLDSGGECAPTIPGPTLTIPPGDTTLEINLRNELPEPVSIVIAGLPLPDGALPVTFVDSKGRNRVRSFTKETASDATEIYTFNGIKAGTYLYSSGTHPAVQVQMGLYGAATNDADINGEAYSGVLYDHEVILLYSEIDPALHAAVANGSYGTSAYPSTINYAPRYFLVNGDPYGDGYLPAGLSGDRTLVRLLNAGLDNHSILLQGQHLSAIAEDGNLYPYPREQYALLMAAGKTRDAIFAPPVTAPPTANGSFPIYDRRLRIGMFSNLVIDANLLAVNDSATIDEDALATSIDVLANDIATSVTSVVIVRAPSHGSANVMANEVVYTPDANFHGSDDLTYEFVDGSNTSNKATVSLVVRSVNDAPVAVNDNYVVEAASRGNRFDVLSNDSDVEGDTLSIGGPQGFVSSNGARILKIGTTQLSYSAPVGWTGTDVFNYELSDGAATTLGQVSVVVGGTVETPTIETPTPNSTLTGASETFTWAANDTEVDQWWVYAGDGVRNKKYFDSGNLYAATSTTVTNLPTDGTMVYITVWHRQLGGSWRTVVDTYTASGP